MQQQQESSTWCGEEVSCQASWEQEEEVEIGMWSNTPSHRDRDRDGHRENHRDRDRDGHRENHRDGHGQDNRNNGPQQHSWNYMKKIPPKVLLRLLAVGQLLGFYWSYVNLVSLCGLLKLKI